MGHVTQWWVVSFPSGQCSRVEGRFDLREHAEAMARLIRLGRYPYPHAFVEVRIPTSKPRTAARKKRKPAKKKAKR